MTATNQAIALRQEAQITDIRPVDAGQIMFEVLSKGDLANLSDEEIARYEVAVCRSVGLNPLTKPFDVITLPGNKKTGTPDRKVLYANRNAGDQLCGIHKITREIVKRELVDGVYVVTARASTPDGRSDESIGAVPLLKEGGSWKRRDDGEGSYFAPDGTFTPLPPDQRANKMMHAETKAKRRAVLSLVGLSFLDESELDTMGDLGSGARIAEVRPHETGPVMPSLGTGAATPAAPPDNAIRVEAVKAINAAVRKAFGQVDNAKEIRDAIVCHRYGLQDFREATPEQLRECARAVGDWSTEWAPKALSWLQMVGSAANATMATDVALVLEDHGVQDLFILQALSDALGRFEQEEAAKAAARNRLIDDSLVP